MAEIDKVVGSSVWLFNELTNYGLRTIEFVQLGPLRHQFWERLEEGNERR